MSGVLAVIPARGGSKSIRRKNARSLGGHPLLAWSLAAAREARSVTRVLLTTDDPEMRALGQAYGAEAPFLRPAELAQDTTRDYPVMVHALDWLEQQEGYVPELVVQLRPTSPLRPPGLVDAGIAALRAVDHADSLRAVVPALENPFKMWRLERGLLHPLLTCEGVPEPYNAPRQELPEALWQTGHLEVIRTRTLRLLGSLTGASVLPLLVDRRYAVDIDTQADWRLAEERLGTLECVRPQGPARGPFAGLRMVVFDFDGVFTDDRVYVAEDGRESVACSRGDGLGLRRLRAHGIRATVLSTETNPVVAARCRKLGLPCRQGIGDKGAALCVLAAQAGLGLDQIAYLGNDVNDLDCLRLARVGVAVADARPEVREAADWVLEARGGRGAVRELCELVIAHCERDPSPQAGELLTFTGGADE